MNTPNPLEDRLLQCEKLLAEIQLRNDRVSQDKAWETSRARVFSVLLLTYAVMCLVFFSLGADKVALQAIIPTTGYFLSTQSLPVIKRIWQRYRK